VFEGVLRSVMFSTVEKLLSISADLKLNAWLQLNFKSSHTSLTSLRG
jgi:hypothetical protein